MPRLGHIKLANRDRGRCPRARSVGARRRTSAVAALQVTLRHHHVYRGPVDGIVGGATTAAVMRFQRLHGLTPDGVAGPKTGVRSPVCEARAGLAHPRARMTGWDVAELQFRARVARLSDAAIDGGFGRHVKHALIKFQRWRTWRRTACRSGTFRA